MAGRITLLIALACLLFAQPQPPGQATLCGGGVTVLLNGQPFSAGCVLNIKAGNGIIATPAANPAIGGTDISFSFNTALIATHDTVHANENYCASANNTSAYTCKLPYKALAGYQAGEIFLLFPDVACAGNCSVDIDNNGSKNLWNQDGVTAATFPAQIPLWIWYDGKTMRRL